MLDKNVEMCINEKNASSRPGEDASKSSIGKEEDLLSRGMAFNNCCFTIWKIFSLSCRPLFQESKGWGNPLGSHFYTATTGLRAVEGLCHQGLTRFSWSIPFIQAALLPLLHYQYSIFASDCQVFF